MSNEIFKQALIDAAEREFDDIPSDEEIAQTYEFSKEFEAKMKKLQKKSKRRYIHIFNRPIRRIAGIAVCILAVVTASLSVEAIRTPIFKLFTVAYEKYIDIKFVDTESNQNNMHESIDEVYLPTYIPDGFWEYEVSKSGHNVRAGYTDNENQAISYMQMILSTAINIDGEDYIESEININGIDGKIYEYDKPDGGKYCTVIWNDNKYCYMVVGFSDREKSIKVARSVTLQDGYKIFIDEKISELYLPSYIPDNSSEFVISKLDYTITVRYINTKNQEFSYHQGLTAEDVNIDAENYTENDININGTDGKIYEYEKSAGTKSCLITWTDGKYFYQIFSDIEKEETIKIAENVTLKESK